MEDKPDYPFIRQQILKDTDKPKDPPLYNQPIVEVVLKSGLKDKTPK